MSVTSLTGRGFLRPINFARTNRPDSSGTLSSRFSPFVLRPFFPILPPLAAPREEMGAKDGVGSHPCQERPYGPKLIYLKKSSSSLIASLTFWITSTGHSLILILIALGETLYVRLKRSTRRSIIALSSPKPTA